MNLSEPKPEWVSDLIWNKAIKDAEPMQPKSVAAVVQKSPEYAGSGAGADTAVESDGSGGDDFAVEPNRTIEAPKPLFTWGAQAAGFVLPPGQNTEKEGQQAESIKEPIVFYRASFYSGWLWRVDGKLLPQRSMPVNGIIRGDIGNPPDLEKAYLYRIDEAQKEWVRK